MLMAQLMWNETAYAWVLLTLNRTILRGVLPYISHIGTGKPLFNMDISLARTVGFVLGERKPLPFLYIRTLSMVPSVSLLLEYGFCTPTMNSQEYPPDTILTMSLDLNFSPWEKKVINNENKKKCFGYVLIEKPLAENIIKVNNLCPL